MIAFVGKEAYRGPFRERPEHGLQERRLGETALFVLPSTSPANAAVPWEERLRWFRAICGARRDEAPSDRAGVYADARTSPTEARALSRASGS